MMLIFSFFLLIIFIVQQCTTIKKCPYEKYSHTSSCRSVIHAGNTQCQSSSRLCMFVSYCFVTLQFVCLSFRFYTTFEPVWSEKIRLGYLYHDKEDELWDDGVEVFLFGNEIQIFPIFRIEYVSCYRYSLRFNQEKLLFSEIIIMIHSSFKKV